MTPRTVVFLGPSLPQAQAARLHPTAEWHPPIQRGDLDDLMREPPGMAGIVDGLLFQSFAISPKEVLRLLRAEWTVYGSSSIGALRAVELERYGMRGIGTVFEMYRSGAIDGDDEVAMVYSADGRTGLSDALVSIRCGLALACQRGVVSQHSAAVLTRCAKRLYFPDRSWRRVIAECRGRVADADLAALTAFIEAECCDVKRDDAIALVKTLAAIQSAQAGAGP